MIADKSLEAIATELWDIAYEVKQYDRSLRDRLGDLAQDVYTHWENLKSAVGEESE